MKYENYIIKTSNSLVFYAYYAELCKHFDFLEKDRFGTGLNASEISIDVSLFTQKEGTAAFWGFEDDFNDDRNRYYEINEIDLFIKDLKALLENQQTIKLNNEYEAIVSKSGIQVGCQNFDLDVIPKLYAAYQKLTNSGK